MGDCFSDVSIIAGGNNCSSPSCTRELQVLLWHINRQLANNSKFDPERIASADLYTVVILCLFASIILLLMVRAIRPSESVDDQVTILLNSMRVRVEDEENTRQRRKLQAAKKKAQRWLAEAKSRSVKKLSFSGSFRNRCTSDSDAITSAPEKASLKSNPISTIGINPRALPPKQLCQRAASYQFLPEIVVTGSHVEQQNYHAQHAAMQPQPLTHSRSYSRVPSTPSIDETSTDFNPNGCKEEVFSVV